MNDTTLFTAAIADASVRLQVPIRIAPAALVPLLAGSVFSGRAQPITHLGSVDVLLESIDDAPPGAVLIVDNGGRDDEACVGDLIALEARLAGLSGIVIWGRHRDTAQLRAIDGADPDRAAVLAIGPGKTVAHVFLWPIYAGGRTEG